MEGTPGRYDKYVPDLNGFLERSASDEYYAKHLTGVDLETEESEDGEGGSKEDDGDEDFEAKVKKEADDIKKAASGDVYD
jgi:hypothetical protein